MAYAPEGKSRIKPSVRAATTANITLSGEQTVDTVALTTGERCLVKNQSTGSQNGIYVVSSGAWARATDFDQDAESKSGDLVYVREGTNQGLWQLTTNDPIVLGTTALTFAETGGGGGSVGPGTVDQVAYFDSGTTVTSSAGLTYDGTTLGVDGPAVFNDSGAAVDLRVEGDTEQNLLVVDGSADRVGIGTPTPAVRFQVVSASAGTLAQVLSTGTAGPLSGGGFSVAQNDGSVMQIGERLGQIGFQGWNGANMLAGAEIEAFANGTWNSVGDIRTSYLTLSTAPSTGGEAVERLRVTEQGSVWLTEIATPSNPASGFGAIYFKADGELYVKNDAGTESQVSNQSSVTVTGTPVDNQLAVWTSASDLEGVPNLTWDGSIFQVSTSVGGTVGVYLNTSAASVNGGGAVSLAHNDGTAMQAGERLGVFGFQGWTGANTLTGAEVEAFASGAWNNVGNIRQSYLTLSTASPAGGGALERFRVTEEGSIWINEIATPSNPASGFGAIYFKADGELYVKNDAGTESQVSNQASDVTITGTPVNNQLAVWTSASAIEGDANLTWDGSVLSVQGTAQQKTHAAFAGSSEAKVTGAVQTTDATATTALTLTLADDTVYWVEATIAARDTAGTERAAYRRLVRAHRQGGGAATLGTVDTSYTDESNAAMDATFTVSGNDLRVTVTGIAATTINWACTLRYQGVSGNT